MQPENTLNASEEFVFQICRRSFLSLWSYANPRKPDKKELCDILIVCEPDIIIFSVKECKIGTKNSPEIEYEKWKRSAIDKSIRQVYGAERILKTMPCVIKKDGGTGLPLSKSVNWKIHRIAVAIGGHGNIPLEQGISDKGFVHIFDEISFAIILQELDTITDFVHYLTAKERLLTSGTSVIVNGAEQDLLALYIHRERRFPEGVNLFVIEHGLWDSISDHPEWQRRKEDDLISYAWDVLIENVCDGLLSISELGDSLNDNEIVPRVMAKETRFSRRMRGKMYTEFVKAGIAQKLHSRIVPSDNETGYVFVHWHETVSEERKRNETLNRSLVARQMLENTKTIIGIGSESSNGSYRGVSVTTYIHKPKLTKEDQLVIKHLVEAGLFKAPLKRRLLGNEFPQSPSDVLHTVNLPRSRNARCPCNSGKKYKHCCGKT